MLAPWHFWTVFVGTGALLVLLAYLGGRRPRLNPREVAEGDGPAGCGNCGYDVRGLPSDVCPECGSDLNVVGRFTPRFRRWQRVPPVLGLAAWTLAVVVVGGSLIVFAESAFVPQLMQHRAWSHYFADRGRTYISVTIDLTTTRIVWPNDSGLFADSRLGSEPFGHGTIAFQVRPMPREHVEPATVSMKSEAGSWFALDGSAPPTAVDAAALDKLLREAGLDKTGDSTPDLALSALRLLERAAPTDYAGDPPANEGFDGFRWMSGSQGVYRLGAWRPLVAAIVSLWIVVWAIGIPPVLRRRTTFARLRSDGGGLSSPAHAAQA